MSFFCDLHLSHSETVLLQCEGLEMSPIILALEVISYSTSTSPWSRLHGHGTRGTQMKGCYYFINEILLNILEVN